MANIEADQGRQLTESELHRLAELDTRAELRGEDHIDAGEALLDLDDSTDRAEYIGQRLEAPRGRTEASAVQVDEDGDELPSFNVESRDERAAAIDA